MSDGWFKRYVLRPLGTASNWRATLHLIVAPLWAALTAAVLTGGVLLALSPLQFLNKAVRHGTTDTSPGWVLLVMALSVPVTALLALMLTGYLLEACAKAETAWYRHVMRQDIVLALRLPSTDGSLWRAFRLMITNSVRWRLMLYTLVRSPVALVTGIVVGGGWILLIAYIAQFGREPFVALLAVAAIPLMPHIARGCLVIHVELARAFLGRMSAEELEARVGEVEQRRTDAMEAAESERRRIERNLHDGAQQQLVALAMMLGRARRRYDTDPEGTKALLDEAHRNAKEAIVELRELTRGLNPPVLNDRGLDAALSALAARSEVPVSIEYDVARRPGRTTESIAYFMIAESLTNVAKHSKATRAAVVTRRTGNVLRIEVRDDGIGGATATPGSGLAGLADRASGVDGTLTVYSPAGGPTTVIMELPCES